GRKLTIPLHRNLLAVLAAAERDQVTIINTEYAKPFTVGGFSQWFRDAITAAGLPLDCQPHGLRKAAGRRLAEAGGTAPEIIAGLRPEKPPGRGEGYGRGGTTRAGGGRRGRGLGRGGEQKAPT